MTTALVGELFRLRYKLLWARTRTRNGKIVMFFVGYLLFVLIALLLSVGGIGAGVLAVRSGRAQFVAQLVLTSIFVQTLVTTVIMGFGMNAIFSDVELRRYPLNATERRLTRHLVGIVDPFWFLGLALELGLAFALYALGATWLVQGVLAVLLLFLTNYLLARVIGMILDRLLTRKAGSMILMSAVILLALALGSAGALVQRFPGAQPPIVAALHYTPPFGTAAAITGSGLPALYGYAIELWWLIGLGAALIVLERRPPAPQTEETGVISFAGPVDRIAGIFGPEHAPLIAQWLRFYFRNSRFKALYLLTLPLVGFLTFNFGRRQGGTAFFVGALSTFPIISFMGVARITLNQFGYTGGGFRRYLLLPVRPENILRTGNWASMFLGSLLIPLAALAWIVFAPMPFDGRMICMLLSAAVTGLFTFHGLALWATLYGPRRGDYSQGLGNDLSLLGNIVLIGGILSFLFGTMALNRSAPGLLRPEHWQMMLLPLALSFLFYVFSLRAAGPIFHRKREWLMAVVEGRS